MDLISKLQNTKVKTLDFFNLPAESMQWTYAPGKWTIRQLLIHLADTETVLYDRIRRTIAEQPKPVLWSFDQDAWAAHLDYASFPLDAAKEMYSGTRSAVIHVVHRYYISHGDLSFVHSTSGLRTLQEEMDKVAWHNQHHLDQIELAIIHKI